MSKILFPKLILKIKNSYNAFKKGILTVISNLRIPFFSLFYPSIFLFFFRIRYIVPYHMHPVFLSTKKYRVFFQRAKLGSVAVFYIAPPPFRPHDLTLRTFGILPDIQCTLQYTADSFLFLSFSSYGIIYAKI